MRLIIASEATRQGARSWRVACVEAEKRALQLLIDNLSPKQREQYETSGYFDVIGSDTGNRYRIRHGSQMNVEELDGKSGRVRLLCFMPEGPVPVGDVMLAQKIALELFEPDAIKIAHRSPAWDSMSVQQVHTYRRAAGR